MIDANEYYLEQHLKAEELSQRQSDNEAQLAELWITPGQELYPYQNADTFLEGLCEYMGDLTPIVEAFRAGDWAEGGRLINEAQHAYFFGIALDRAEGWSFS